VEVGDARPWMLSQCTIQQEGQCAYIDAIALHGVDGRSLGSRWCGRRAIGEVSGLRVDFFGSGGSGRG
jgi:hypothetical protein